MPAEVRPFGRLHILKAVGLTLKAVGLVLLDGFHYSIRQTPFNQLSRQLCRQPTQLRSFTLPNDNNIPPEFF